MKLTGRKNGFTIVELLVVIVVIGILAALSIVAYSGIQTRAENTKTLTGIDQFGKALQLYKSDNGGFPLVNKSGSGAFTYACVASDAARACARVAGSDTSCSGVGPAVGSTTLNNALKTVISSPPDVSSQDMGCDNKTVRGALYYVHIGGANDYNAYILYFLKGNEQCTTPAGATLVTTQVVTGTTRCTILFAA